MKKGNTRQSRSTQSKLECFLLQNYETVSVWGGKRLVKIIFLLRFNFEGKKNNSAFALN